MIRLKQVNTKVWYPPHSYLTHTMQKLVEESHSDMCVCEREREREREREIFSQDRGKMQIKIT